ncbi:MAG TPA: tetratricopeptide repeat protein [Candidatus Krumholzibacteria bacterium]|nr:tetratricopeptide repeat protein [Candidatus Krumholzibacteria bacterium]
MVRTPSFLVLAGLLAAAGCSSLSSTNSPYQNRVSEQQRRRATTYMQHEQYTAAAATLDSLVLLKPRDSDLFEMLGDARRGTGDTEGAIKAYEQSMRLNYGAFAPHMKLGTLLMESGRTGRALTEFELAVKASDRDVLARYNYGVALYQTGRRDEALQQWGIAEDIDPSNVRVAEALGMGYSGVNDSTAVAEFERATQLGSDSATFHNNYALTLDRLGRTQEAETQFRLAVEKAPAEKRDEYRRNFALHLLRTGRDQEAADEFAGLIESSGGLWSDTVYLARARMELGKYDDAIAGLEPFALDVESGKIPADSKRIDRMPPTLDDALDILGMCWRGKGNHRKAVDYLKRAVALKPADVTHLNNYGVALADDGMLAKAREQWRRVLEIDPQNATAKANLSAFGR